jgi:hypothetical protein
MPKYRPHRTFINNINGGFPIVDNQGYFVLNHNNERMIGIEIDGVFEAGHLKSTKSHIFISQQQLIELRGILDAAIFDLYDGVEMSSMFDTDIT